MNSLKLDKFKRGPNYTVCILHDSIQNVIRTLTATTFRQAVRIASVLEDL